VVTVVVETVLEKTLVVRVRVDVEVEYTVTCAGVVVMVRVEVLVGTVMVEGRAMTEKTLVMVEVIVVEGVVVTVNMAVGVDVTVTGGAAMIENDRMYANVKPSMMAVHVPENILFLVNSFPETLLGIVNREHVLGVRCLTISTPYPVHQVVLLYRSRSTHHHWDQ
jgi:hypothetical protein